MHGNNSTFPNPTPLPTFLLSGRIVAFCLVYAPAAIYLNRLQVQTSGLAQFPDTRHWHYRQQQKRDQSLDALG